MMFTKDVGSRALSISRSDAVKIAKGVAISAGAAGFTYLLDFAIPVLQSRPGANAALFTVLAFVINLVRKWLVDTRQMVFPLFLLACLSSLAHGQDANPARASYRVWVQDGNGRSGGSSTGISPHILVTNVHVVGGAKRAEVLHPLLGKRWEGHVVARDPAADVALVYVPTGDLEWVNVGSDPQPNQPCKLLATAATRS